MATVVARASPIAARIGGRERPFQPLALHSAPGAVASPEPKAEPALATLADMQDASTTTHTQRLLAVLVCACLLVQPLWVPLHLALAEHTFGNPGAAAGSHAHDHVAGHRHPHPHSHRHPHELVTDEVPPAGEDDGDPTHPPHPAQDHVSQTQPQHVPPGTDAGPAALPCVVVGFECDPAPARAAREAPPRIPERPPPLGLVQPRAPPSTA